VRTRPSGIVRLECVDASGRTAGTQAPTNMRPVFSVEKFTSSAIEESIGAQSSCGFGQLIAHVCPEKKETGSAFEDYVCDDGLRVGPYR